LCNVTRQLWGGKLATFANDALKAQSKQSKQKGNARLLVNVASDEYSKAILAHATTHFDDDVVVVTCVFKHQVRPPLSLFSCTLLFLSCFTILLVVVPCLFSRWTSSSFFFPFIYQGRVIAVHAKRARGLMARFVAVNDCQTLDDLKAFDSDNYKFESASSDDTTLVFNRSAAPPKPTKEPKKAKTTTKAKTTPKSSSKVAKTKGNAAAAARPAKRQKRT
jgi:hypothetical protein